MKTKALTVLKYLVAGSVLFAGLWSTVTVMALKVTLKTRYTPWNLVDTLVVLALLAASIGLYELIKYLFSRFERD